MTRQAATPTTMSTDRAIVVDAVSRTAGTHVAATTSPKAASAPRSVRSRMSQTPIADRGDEEGQGCPGSVDERHASGRRDRAAVQVCHVAAGKGEEDARDEGAVRVASTDRDPGQRHGLGRPGEGYRRRAELDRRGHREGGDPGPDREEPEEVPVSVSDDERPADAELGQRDQDQEEPAIDDQVAAQQHEAGPDDERDVGEQQGRRRWAQVVALAAECLAAGGHEVEQPRRDRSRAGRPRVPGGR